MSKKIDIRTDITKQIVDSIELGFIPWRKANKKSETTGGLPANFHSKRRYTGVNTVILLQSAEKNKFSSNCWGSSLSVLNHTGAYPKNLENPTFITLFKMIPRKNKKGIIEKNKKGQQKLLPLLRLYPLYNLDQYQAPTVESLLSGEYQHFTSRNITKQKKLSTNLVDLKKIARKYCKNENIGSTREQVAYSIQKAVESNLLKYKLQNDKLDISRIEDLLKKIQIPIIHGGSKSFYDIDNNFIQIPDKNQFESIIDYYQIVFHELSHWVIAKNNKEKCYDYAFEELVAELSSCFVLAELGIAVFNDVVSNARNYIAAWLEQMNNNSKYIFEASFQANKVVDFLIGFSKKN